MANIKTQIFRVLNIKRCTTCRRKLNDAIAEQVDKQKPCDPNYDCKFKKEIEEAILFSKKPELLEFTSNKNEILENETVTLEWEIFNAKKCSINGVGRVENKGSRKFRLKKSKEFVITFESYKGELYKSEPILIKILPLPEIIEVIASSKEIIRGKSTKVSWKSKNVFQSYLIMNGVEKQVEPNGFVDITPEIDTEIILHVIGHLNKEITKSEKIIVHEPVQIHSFTSNRTKLIENETLKFFFDVENASKIYLSGGSIVKKIDVSTINEFEFQPQLLSNHSSLQTFHLEIYDKLNNPLPKVPLTIEVFPIPEIISFETSKNKILIGEEVKLEWNVKKYSKIQL